MGKTKIELIQTMSAKELAEFLMRVSDCAHCLARANNCCVSNTTCHEAWLNYLNLTSNN